MRHQPAQQEHQLSIPDVIHRNGPDHNAVVKHHQDGAQAPCHSEREREDGHFDVVCDQIGRKVGLSSFQPIAQQAFFLFHAFGRP